MKIVYTLILTLSFSNIFGHKNQIIKSNQSKPYFIHENQTESNFNTALIELSEGINPKAFNKAWKTEGAAWSDKVKGASDIATLSASLLSFSEHIKPKFFKPSWEKAKDKWVKQVKEARSNLALAGLLKSLYNNLTPETFTKDWPSKGAQWVETLNKIE
ncbi:MAG TPA: hypothetical protein PK323_14520 [Bacteroidia bacterium]|nr:hypothetical protein [Bacteroidia bacterium]